MVPTGRATHQDSSLRAMLDTLQGVTPWAAIFIWKLRGKDHQGRNLSNKEIKLNKDSKGRGYPLGSLGAVRAIPYVQAVTI